MKCVLERPFQAHSVHQNVNYNTVIIHLSKFD